VVWFYLNLIVAAGVKECLDQRAHVHGLGRQLDETDNLVWSHELQQELHKIGRTAKRARDVM
jgi:hypothetical protein